MGFAGTVTPSALNWSNIPGATASWSPATVNVPSNGPATANFTIQTSATTTPGTYGNIILRGTNGAITKAASAVSVTVNGPQLTGSMTPTTRIVGVTPVSILGTATPNGTVRCTDTSPDGTIAVYEVQANSSGNYTFGPYIIPQLGQYVCLLRDLTTGQELSLPYSGSGDFSSSVNATSRTITRGQTASYVVTFSSMGGFAGKVKPFALNWSNIPGTNASWTPTEVNVPSGGSGQATFTIQTSASTTPGTYGNMTLFGKNGSFSRSVQSSVSLTVNSSNPAPTITPPISPSSVTYNQPTTVTVNGSNFRPGLNVAIITPNCPSANPCWIQQPAIEFVNSSQLRVQVVMLGAPPYSATLKVVNDDGQFDTETFQVTGAGNPEPTINNIAPNPVTVNQTTTLTVTGTNFVNEPTVKVTTPDGTWDIHPSKVQFDNSNQIRVEVNMGSTPPYQATLHVKNPDQQSATRQFSVVGITPVLELIALEVTQGIQNFWNDIVLIGSKKTYVRAHVRSLAGDVSNVRAQLSGTRNGGSLGSPLTAINSSSGLSTGSIKVKSSPQRSSRNDSFLFELPPDWVNGSVELTFAGISHSFMFNEVDGTSDGRARVIFQNAPPLKIKLVRVDWPILTGPSDDKMKQVENDIRVMLPSGLIQISNGSINSTHQPRFTEDYFQQIVVPQLTVKRLSECGWNGCDTYYLGIVDQELANPFPLSPRILGYASTSFDYDCNQNRRGDVAAAFFVPFQDDARFTHVHELGHLFGRFHTNYNGVGDGCQHVPSNGTIGFVVPSQYSPYAVYGFDGVNSFPSNTPDVMSYGDWPFISRFTYEKILEHVRDRFAASQNVKDSANIAYQGSDVLLISGTLERNQPIGNLTPVYKLPAASNVHSAVGGGYEIAFYDSINNRLVSYDFEPEFSSVGEVGSFGLLLPPHPNVTRISLERNGQELAYKLASLNVPTVTVTSPNGGEILNGNSSTIEWVASDLDGDQLNFLVQFSGDNGSTWTTLNSNLTENHHSVNLDTLPGTGQGRIRVLASDGFHTALDQSDNTFTVAGRGPTVNILTPGDNSSYVGVQPVMLQGTANDLEDGELSGTALKWISNLDGQIGTGQSLSMPAINLTEGVHTISLSAQDSEGFIGTKSVTVTIHRSQPVLPPRLSLAPSAMSFVANQGSGVTDPQVLAVRNDGDGDLNWTASANQSWIQLGNTSGSAPFNLSVTANATGLPIGAYAGQITILTTDAPNSPQTVEVQFVVVSPTVNSRAPFDFDGDGKTDVGIFRPGPAEWWYRRSSDGQVPALQFGTSTDAIAPVDYTGDGKSDVAFFRPTTGEWFILRSEDGSFYSFPFGGAGDTPVPADYDGDGKGDVAVFRSTNNTWYIQRSSDLGVSIITFGASGDLPVTADYDGDGKSDIGIFRPGPGEWWYLRSSDGGNRAFQFGTSTDKTVVGDYTGDGKADAAFFRPTTGEWFILRSEDGSFYSFPFGGAGDTPVPGDYDGDGKTDAAVFRPSSATWFMLGSTSGTQIIPFGAATDRPIPNAFVR
ncbi:MAG: VCBS repeat-containing protein [Chloracidobacterium sp.]|nr:VCBS repeat-containing protein [Chloracidobacterium sp.]